MGGQEETYLRVGLESGALGFVIDDLAIALATTALVSRAFLHGMASLCGIVFANVAKRSIVA